MRTSAPLLYARVAVDHRRCAEEFDRLARNCTERQRDTDRRRVRWTDDARDLRAAQRFTGVTQRRGRTFARVALSPRPRRQRICDLERRKPFGIQAPDAPEELHRSRAPRPPRGHNLAIPNARRTSRADATL